MSEYNELFNMAVDTFKKLLYPGEWIDIDLSLSKTELFTLLQTERNGEIIMSQIADYINIPMSTATGLVERLVKKGYLKRARSESDRRVVTIQLTDAGKKITAEIRETIGSYIKLVLDDLTEEEKNILLGLFDKITGILSRKRMAAGNLTTGGSVLKKIEIE
jgi:DNA-binding MarR family transcriptional regulator